MYIFIYNLTKKVLFFNTARENDCLFGENNLLCMESIKIGQMYILYFYSSTFARFVAIVKISPKHLVHASGRFYLKGLLFISNTI